MDAGLYHATSAMRAGEQRLETIANNIANVSTRGYKRETTFTHALQTSRTGGQRVVSGSQPDMSQGALEANGNPFDLAIEGRGWFVVETPGGRSYTRDGSFRLDERGTLLTQDGFPVAWKGSRGVLRPAGQEVAVDADGRVRQGEAVVGQLDVVELDAAARLVPTAEGRWFAPQGASETTSKASVRQGFVERSNVNAMDELVALITIQRSVESAATAVRTIEQSYRRLNQPR